MSGIALLMLTLVLFHELAVFLAGFPGAWAPQVLIGVPATLHQVARIPYEIAPRIVMRPAAAYPFPKPPMLHVWRDFRKSRERGMGISVCSGNCRRWVGRIAFRRGKGDYMEIGARGATRFGAFSGKSSCRVSCTVCSEEPSQSAPAKLGCTPASLASSESWVVCRCRSNTPHFLATFG